MVKILNQKVGCRAVLFTGPTFETLWHKLYFLCEIVNFKGKVNMRPKSQELEKMPKMTLLISWSYCKFCVIMAF